MRRPFDAHSAYRASLHRATLTRTISESDRRLATPLWRAHIADSALCGYRVQVAFVAFHISRLWMPFRVVEGFGLSPGVRVWVVSVRRSLPRWAAGAPARFRELARRAWVLLLTALRWCWRRSVCSPGRPARGPARRRRVEASWGPGSPGITAAGAAGHRRHALVFGTAACVASAAPGG